MMSRVLRMKASAAGPEGSWSAGYEYSAPGHIPEDVAEQLVEAGSAEWIEGATVPKGPSPAGRAPK